MNTLNSPIGVFDSGIGGLSILQALRKALPHERFVYFADSAHNPYGVKTQEFVRERSLAIAQELVAAHQIKALVVACNTATAAAIDVLRLAYPQLPIVGIEPALKPAAAATRNGRILVLATRGTLESEKFKRLKAQLAKAQVESAQVEWAHAQRRPALDWICVPCDGLAERIEQLSVRGEPLENASDLIADCAGNIRASDRFDEESNAFDTLVLGCTHYPLVRQVFRSLVGEGVTIVDNAQPVAQRTAQLLSHRLAEPSQTGSVLWLGSGGRESLEQAARYWGLASAL